MWSSAITPTLPLLPVEPLDGESGYLRWKESVLLRLHSLNLAHVLSERPAAKKKRARDDALCRGHILATLSDRLLPVYAHHATATDVWSAVARTYDLNLDLESSFKAHAFQYDERKPLLEQLAVLQALATAGKFAHNMKPFIETAGFPTGLLEEVDDRPAPPAEEIWEIARQQVVLARAHKICCGELATDEQGSRSYDSRPRKRGRQ